MNFWESEVSLGELLMSLDYTQYITLKRNAFSRESFRRFILKFITSANRDRHSRLVLFETSNAKEVEYTSPENGNRLHSRSIHQVKKKTCFIYIA